MKDTSSTQETSNATGTPEYLTYSEQPASPQHDPIVISDAGIDTSSIWLASLILKMMIVVAFALTTWVSLRILDWLNKASFAEWLNRLDDEQKTIYYSTRFFAVVIGSAIVFAFGGGL